jgi:hypothetical protein
MRNLTFDDFSGSAGADYSVAIEGGTVPLTLAQIEPLADSGREGGSFRLLFLGPQEPILPQAIHVFRSDGEEMEIFIVPVGRDQKGTHYEAIFF